MKKLLLLFALVILLGFTPATNESSTKYIVKFELYQSHFTLDIGTHLKDAMNSVEFEVPVDRDYYYSLRIGDKVVDRFRVGSAILYGSFGSWNMKVKDKRIVR